MKYSFETVSFGKKNLHIIQETFPVWTVVQRRDQGIIISGVFFYHFVGTPFWLL